MAEETPTAVNINPEDLMPGDVARRTHHEGSLTDVVTGTVEKVDDGDVVMRAGDLWRRFSMALPEFGDEVGVRWDLVRAAPEKMLAPGSVFTASDGPVGVYYASRLAVYVLSEDGKGPAVDCASLTDWSRLIRTGIVPVDFVRGGME